MRLLLMFCLALGIAGGARADEAAAWTALRGDGAVALMRHEDAPGIGDPQGYDLGNCATQRNLSEQGRTDARAAGRRLREEGVAIGRLVSSPWCRCLDTARLLGLGEVVTEPAFGNSYVQRDQSDALADAGRRLIADWGGPGSLLAVTHGNNIRALTGVSPAEGEIVVVKRDGTLIGRLQPAR